MMNLLFYLKRIILNADYITRKILYYSLYNKYMALNHRQMIEPYSIPVYIISFNRLNYLKQTINWLERNGHTNIRIIDNKSSYEPLLKFYENCPYKVYKMKKNYGHMVFFKARKFFFIRNFKCFCITDPDILPIDKCPINYMSLFTNILMQKYFITKVGFSLKIDDLPDEYNLKNKVIEWESHFYKNKLFYNNVPIYLSEIDTTFAIYRPLIFCPLKNFLKAFRVGYPYEAKHLPWYVTNRSTEDQNYNDTVRKDITTWNGNLSEETLSDRLKIVSKNDC